jgi:2-amino-4-hydroxy-6-hydroxymethyldihydropteridine diphosphokinase
VSLFNGVEGSGVRAFLGLGSNLSNRERFLNRAIMRFSKNDGIRIRRLSSVYETEPWGVKDQGHFLNMVVEIKTVLEPLALLDACKRIEAGFGRKNGMRWGPRVIDIDVLLYGDRTIQAPGLVIPHPMLAERRFALVPLAEIARGIKVPGFAKTVQVLLEKCSDKSSVRFYRKSKGVSA